MVPRRGLATKYKKDELFKGFKLILENHMYFNIVPFSRFG
jgi:hypothetical protein